MGVKGKETLREIQIIYILLNYAQKLFRFIAGVALGSLVLNVEGSRSAVPKAILDQLVNRREEERHQVHQVEEEKKVAR